MITDNKFIKELFNIEDIYYTIRTGDNSIRKRKDFYYVDTDNVNKIDYKYGRLYTKGEDKLKKHIVKRIAELNLSRAKVKYIDKSYNNEYDNCFIAKIVELLKIIKLNNYDINEIEKSAKLIFDYTHVDCKGYKLYKNKMVKSVHLEKAREDYNNLFNSCVSTYNYWYGIYIIDREEYIMTKIKQYEMWEKFCEVG